MTQAAKAFHWLRNRCTHFGRPSLIYAAFPPRNLKYLRAFAAAKPEGGIVQVALARIP